MYKIRKPIKGAILKRLEKENAKLLLLVGDLAEVNRKLRVNLDNLESKDNLVKPPTPAQVQKIQETKQ